MKALCGGEAKASQWEQKPQRPLHPQEREERAYRKEGAAHVFIAVPSSLRTPPGFPQSMLQLTLTEEPGMTTLLVLEASKEHTAIYCLTESGGGQ